jgi:hypothetical protein
MSVTIHAISIPDQTPSTITLDKTDAAEGTITLDGQSYDVTNITASADGLNMACDGPFGSTITCRIQPQKPPASSFVTVDIKSFIFNSTKHYQVSAVDEGKLVKFIQDSHFPQLQTA